MPVKLLYIILAAGSSSRLGVPKQLLKVGGQTLLRRAATICMASHPGRIVIISGALEREIPEEVAGLPVEVLHNHAWQEGIASSVRKGIFFARNQGMDAAVLLTTDQVRLSSEILDRMIDAYLENKPKIVCCYYDNHAGIPALFDKSLFEDLLSLRGDKGAKQIIANTTDKILIDFPGGELDVDQPGDLDRIG